MTTKSLSPTPSAAALSAAITPPPVQMPARRRVWVGISSAGAVVLGVLPHLLHHVGIFAGALLAGVGGSLLFGVVGFVAAVPFLLHVHRRTASWRMPAVLLALFAGIFSISTFVIGPAISGSSETTSSASDQPIQSAAPGSPELDAHGH